LNAELMGPRHPAIWLLTCGFLLAAPGAHAQTTEVGTRVERSTDAGGNRAVNMLNKAECIRNDTFTFDVTPSAPTSLNNYVLEVWSGSGCGDKATRVTNESCRLVASQTPNGNGNTITVEAQNILGKDGGKNPEPATEEDCTSTTGGENKITLFVLLVDSNDDAANADAPGVYEIEYDLVAPTPPTGISAGVGESSLVVRWSAPDDTEDVSGYRFYCDPPPGGGELLGEGGSAGSAGASGSPTDGCSSSALVPGAAPPEGYGCGDISDAATNGEASGLENGQAYAVAVASVDGYGNVGVLSSLACGTPEPVTGFFEAYRAAGGQAGGGYCAMHAGKSRLSAALVSLALLGFAVRRRRGAASRSRSVPAKAASLFVLGATLLTFSGTAHAQGVDEFGAYGGLEDRGQRRSPQEAAFEIRIGPYRPHIDDAVPGTPYKDIFGSSQRWHAGFEVDWQVFRIERTLSLGPGFSLAYTRAGAKAPLASGTGRSAQDTEIEMLPMFLAGVLRIDALADRTLIPLAPYAKLGFGYALWWASDGEDAARADGVVGKGASYGYTYSLGVLLRLDPLDPADAATADASLGINHSGIFIEWFGSNLDGFGSADVMNVGTNTWVAGLTIEM
jgi:hypothetical protein